MEGSGVTNYATDKPSYAYSTATTEFDEALLQRDIVTPTQVFLAKGASLEQAQRLVMLREVKNVTIDPTNSDDDDDDDDFSDDEEIMQRYRQQRHQQATSVHYIQRNEWHRHVNEASLKQWVVVCLTSSDTERTGHIEQAVKEVARSTTSGMQFVFIPYQHAIEGNWPFHNLPCLFLYRYGVLQKQMMQLTYIHTMESLYELLQSTIENLDSK
ncbi:hypothetical protein FisN_16Lh074 [Fistulifera solaris]|uniref:Phosducin thioredoxin-like domain-containing protein n=1 Tax=Fistulifera solaris TaxID=1519565 RepID=A0A1Z5KJ14_FISSO|nr:hypothetical protein FisN_16Lh074 [Fistulifera solaris]|eukprot:GAX26246.1 hypothetical protein FisN_16Lh074 [Fistulifera solaris]